MQEERLEKETRIAVWRRCSHRHWFLLCVMLGLMVSIFYMGRIDETVLEHLEQEGRSTISLLGDESGQTEQERQEKNRTVIRIRILIPLVWLVGSVMKRGLLVYYGGGLYLGFSAGISWWLLLQMGGWRGPFWLWALLFPHSLCYVPALILWCVALCHWKQYRKHRKFLWKNPVDRRQWNIFMLRIMVAWTLYGLGIWLEVGVNPWFFNKIL